MNKKSLIAAIIKIILGISLASLGAAKLLDSFWMGMGTALIFVGVVSLVRTIRYHSNPDFQKKVNIETNDERNRFLSMKAWSWAGYLFIIIAAFATIGFKLAGYESLMLLCSGSVCLIITIYWIAYLILRKKY